jgi:hypothetical protein
MTILARLERWKEQGAISQEQHAHLASLARGEPFSLFLELELLLVRTFGSHRLIFLQSQPSEKKSPEMQPYGGRRVPRGVHKPFVS